MKTAQWRDYELIDTSDGERLERWGDIILIRPDPEIIWKTEKKHPLWRNAHARYQRSKTGGGAWQTYKPIPDVWKIHYKELTFRAQTHGALSIQACFRNRPVNWDFAMERSGMPGGGAGAQSVRLYGRDDAGLYGGRCHRVPCRRFPRHRAVGPGKCRGFALGRSPRALAGR